MATFSKRGSSWTARVFIKGGPRLTKTFKLKAQAVAWANDQEASLAKHSLRSAEHTVLQALDRYGEEESPKKRGVRWELVRLKKFGKTLPFVDKPIRSVTPSDIASWRDAQTTSPGTIRREMGLLAAVFDVASREWGWVEINPMRNVTKPTPPKGRSVTWSDTLVEAVCAELTGPKEREVALAFRISLETAMRSGEILSLDWLQVDLKKRVVSLEKTKNGDSREVPLSPEALALFESIPHRVGPLFTLTDASRDTLFRKAKMAAGVEGLTFHDARATAITKFARVKKVDVLTLARIVGHRDVKSLMVYYRESAEDIAKRL